MTTMRVRHPVFFGALCALMTVAICSGADGEDAFEAKRNAMVERQIIARGVKDTRVIDAMRRVPRHEFMLKGMARAGYEDAPFPIGCAQTISQPYIVAYMTEALALKSDDKVLEIGTGSGYQAAILAEIVDEVFTIEILLPLAHEAELRLKRLGYDTITVRCADGYLGWEEEAPFDAIMVTAAPATVPQKLVDQLAIGGRMVLPVGEHSQELYLITKTEEGVEKKALLPVRFVPMVHGK
jgi:protein-L-isoaspartate(D-aspartate) O-methyltransferase